MVYFRYFFAFQFSAVSSLLLILSGKYISYRRIIKANCLLKEETNVAMKGIEQINIWASLFLSTYSSEGFLGRYAYSNEERLSPKDHPR